MSVTVRVRGKRGRFMLPSRTVAHTLLDSAARSFDAIFAAPVRSKGKSTLTREKLIAKIERAKAMRNVESVTQLEAKFARLFGNALDADKRRG